MQSFDTKNVDFTQNYKMLIGAILPRPIAVVSTINEDGSYNVAPFSFFTAVSAKPMIVAFSPLIRTSTGKDKDTTLNILRQKDFCINFVTEDNAQKINDASAELEYGQSEFEHAGLTPLKSDLIQSPRVEESPIQFECTLKDHLKYGEGPGSGQIITGEVLKVHVSNEIYKEGRVNTDKFKPIGRGAGNDWIRCTDRFQLERKMVAQIQK